MMRDIVNPIFVSAMLVVLLLQNLSTWTEVTNLRNELAIRQTATQACLAQVAECDRQFLEAIKAQQSRLAIQPPQ